MKRTFLRMLSLLCALLLVGAFALTGCGEEAQTPADNAGNNATEDSHEGHNHGGADALIYLPTLAKDGTYGFTVKTQDGKELYACSDLKYAPIKEKVSDAIFSISWATGTGPNDFETLYCDPAHYRVSKPLTSVVGSDGVRAAYPVKKDGAYFVVVQDIFDAEKYTKEYPLTDAYTGGDYAVLSGRMVDDTHVNVTYLLKANGEHTFVKIDLYEDRQ